MPTKCPWRDGGHFDERRIILRGRAVLKAAPLSWCQGECQRAVPGQDGTKFTSRHSVQAAKCCVRPQTNDSLSEVLVCVCLTFFFSVPPRWCWCDSSVPSMPLSLFLNILCLIEYLTFAHFYCSVCWSVFIDRWSFWLHTDLFFHIVLKYDWLRFMEPTVVWLKSLLLSCQVGCRGGQDSTEQLLIPMKFIVIFWVRNYKETRGCWYRCVRRKELPIFLSSVSVVTSV